MVEEYQANKASSWDLQKMKVEYVELFGTPLISTPASSMMDTIFEVAQAMSKAAHPTEDAGETNEGEAEIEDVDSST